MRRRRSGASLIELVVVLLVVGVLSGLSLRGVASAREAARRAQCLGNVNQLTLAVITHESSRGALPPLYYGTFLPAPYKIIDEFHFHSWRSATLPEIGQGALYHALNFGRPATTPDNQSALNVVLGNFLCPSSATGRAGLPELLAWNGGRVPFAPVGTAARSDYEAVGGVRAGPNPRPEQILGGIRLGAWGEPVYGLAGVVTGVRAGRTIDVSDGLSQTLLIAERAGRPTLYRRGRPPVPYPYLPPPEEGTDPHQAAWGVSTHFQWLVFAGQRGVNDSNSTGIFAFHPGGANVSFADGSARFLTESVSQDVLNALASRAGGEVVGRLP